MKKLLFGAVAGLVLACTATALAAPTTTRVTGAVIRVTAEKGVFRYSATKFSAKTGTITVVFTNLSSLQHNVSLEQGETEYGATVTIGSGTTATILNLKKGVYHLYSSVGNDENKGMQASLTVG